MKDEQETQDVEGEERLEEEEEPTCETEEIILKVEAIPETSTAEERKRIKRSKVATKIETFLGQVTNL